MLKVTLFPSLFSGLKIATCVNIWFQCFIDWLREVVTVTAEIISIQFVSK